MVRGIHITLSPCRLQILLPEWDIESPTLPFASRTVIQEEGSLEALKEITVIDTENIQFCCAEWFWKRQVNSYALQVESERFKYQDRAKLDYKEALHIEKIRNTFFVQLKELLQKQQDRNGTGSQ